MTNTPQEMLRYHVSGAIERGEKQAIVEQPAQHTPGPWYPSNEMIMANKGKVSVADCFGNMKGHLPLSERQANARLIAAAPETAAERDELKERVATLEQILYWCQEAMRSGDALKLAQADYAVREYSIQRAAIAIAKGE